MPEEDLLMPEILPLDESIFVIFSVDPSSFTHSPTSPFETVVNDLLVFAFLANEVMIVSRKITDTIHILFIVFTFLFVFRFRLFCCRVKGFLPNL